MKLFGGGDQPQVQPLQPLPPPPTINDSSVADAAAAERLRQQRAAGRASTDLTSGTDLGPATTAKKELLG